MIGVSEAIDHRRSQVRDDGIASTVMLGLPGFVVLAVSEYAGEVEHGGGDHGRAGLVFRLWGSGAVA
jgi:hypothetical protein